MTLYFSGTRQFGQGTGGRWVQTRPWIVQNSEADSRFSQRSKNVVQVAANPGDDGSFIIALVNLGNRYLYAESIGSGDAGSWRLDFCHRVIALFYQRGHKRLREKQGKSSSAFLDQSIGLLERVTERGLCRHLIQVLGQHRQVFADVHELLRRNHE